MSLAVETVAFKGWPNVLKVSNGSVELLVTLDVGPRILSYTGLGGPNPLNIYDDQAGGVGEPEWRNRGGHRLWLAPESKEFSYYPDNAPVAWERLGSLGVRLTPVPEKGPGFQKQIDLVFEEKSSRITVTHRITRTGEGPCLVAPWALSVMAAGGVALMPQPPMGEHPRDLLPNRRMVVWPYTDLSDARYRFGKSFITLKQVVGARPTKIGFRSSVGWAAYCLGRSLFIKRFGLKATAEYPDEGCNLEVFTNGRMLELESLGALETLATGQKAELVEGWELRDVPEDFGFQADDALARYFQLAPV